MPHECTTCGRTFPDGSKEMLSGCPDCGGNKFQFHPGGKSTSGSESPSSTDATSSSATPGAGGSDPPERPTPPESEPGTPGSELGAPESESGTPESEPGTPRDTGPKTRSAPTSTDSSFTFGSQRSEDRSADADSDPGGVDRSDPGSSGGQSSGDDLESDPTGDNPESDLTGDDPESDPTGSDSPLEDRAQASARSTVVSEDELPASDGDQDMPAETVDGGDRTSDGDGEAQAGQQGGSESADMSELRDELNDQFESIKIHARGEYELNLMELYDREEHIIALQEDGRYVIDVPSSWRRSDEDT
jgi:predicted  nucleic acid-binding Zn-ribbon protein